MIESNTCRNLSILDVEWSGPAPSIPWGNNMTRPLCNNHFPNKEQLFRTIIEFKYLSCSHLWWQSEYSYQKKLPHIWKIKLFAKFFNLLYGIKVIHRCLGSTKSPRKLRVIVLPALLFLQGFISRAMYGNLFEV